MIMIHPSFSFVWHRGCVDGFVHKTNHYNFGTQYRIREVMKYNCIGGMIIGAIWSIIGVIMPNDSMLLAGLVLMGASVLLTTVKKG